MKLYCRVNELQNANKSSPNTRIEALPETHTRYSKMMTFTNKTRQRIYIMYAFKICLAVFLWFIFMLRLYGTTLAEELITSGWLDAKNKPVCEQRINCTKRRLSRLQGAHSLLYGLWRQNDLQTILWSSPFQCAIVLGQEKGCVASEPLIPGVQNRRGGGVTQAPAPAAVHVVSQCTLWHVLSFAHSHQIWLFSSAGSTKLKLILWQDSRSKVTV